MSESSRAQSARGPVEGKSKGSGRGPAKRPKKSGERTSPITFYRQVVAELRKVVWPTQQQLVTYFVVVMVFVVILIAYVSVLDLAFGKAVFAVFGGGGK